MSQAQQGRIGEKEKKGIEIANKKHLKETKGKPGRVGRGILLNCP